MITVAPDADLVQEFDQEAGPGKPKYGQLAMCYDRDEKTARKRARDLWRWAMPGWHVMAELPDPRAFDVASAKVSEEEVAEIVPCGPDTGLHVEAVKQYLDAGFTHVALVQVGGDQQQDFLSWAENELLPALRELG
jgi:G6PDH family F420-dependent oxidoreductase